jgi:uncharacterized protein (DUF983 family)
MAKRGIEDDDIDEGPSAEDMERFGGATRHCPECKTELYDDAEVCWKCGHMLSGVAPGPKTWKLVTAMVVVMVIVGGMLWWIR